METQQEIIERDVRSVGLLEAGDFFREIGEKRMWKVEIPGKIRMAGGRVYEALCVRAVDKQGNQRVFSHGYKVRFVQVVTN